jgi:hypothetical protein
MVSRRSRSGHDVALPAADSGETLGSPSARPTLTFGFGAELFVTRIGMASRLDGRRLLLTCPGSMAIS